MDVVCSLRKGSAMKPVNLLVLAQGFQTIPPELLSGFEAQLSEREERLAAVKPHEAASVIRLVQALRESGACHLSHYEGFVFSFRIPQISSEFDLLKICDSTVVNIELKSENVGVRRMSEQLARTRHYLSPLDRTIYTFTFVSDTGRLYEATPDAGVRRVGMERLVEVLDAAGTAYEGQVEDLFRVSNYLVSPLNDTDKFCEGHYFLTNHQAQIKARFLRDCRTTDHAMPTFMVYGSAGTGKTLLLYDLARSWEGPGKACVIHCGTLCEGHHQLNERQETFCIIPAKGCERLGLHTYGALFVDEAQRMWPSQLKHIVDIAANNHIPLYLSLDRRQVFTHAEDTYDIEKAVRTACPATIVWELSRKIRTNRELADFIRALFGLRGHERYVRTNHVKVGSAQDTESARLLVDAFRGEGYQFISLANTARDDLALDELDIPGCPNPYAVIGQEFDRVVMAVGPHISLDSYRHRQLLYQSLTRARSEIAFVVYGNDAFLRKLLGML